MSKIKSWRSASERAVHGQEQQKCNHGHRPRNKVHDLLVTDVRTATPAERARSVGTITVPSRTERRALSLTLAGYFIACINAAVTGSLTRLRQYLVPTHTGGNITSSATKEITPGLHTGIWIAPTH
ncbi:hypothetical protein Bbelb_062320 [Branchiostoma belcheri]|nr:hypothetical protein Bbelb_062320 [Branchiostoma belcheri]